MSKKIAEVVHELIKFMDNLFIHVLGVVSIVPASSCIISRL